jgi:DNA-directed RNA polymerase subunit beta
VQLELVPERLRGETLDFDLADGDKVIVEAGKRITARHVRSWKRRRRRAGGAGRTTSSAASSRTTSSTPKTGELLASANDELNDDILAKFRKAGIIARRHLWVNDLDRGPYISNTLRIDPTKTQLEALVEIYRMMRPGEPPTKDAAQNLFHNLFFTFERYDLSGVGRMKFNRRVGRKEVTGASVLYDAKYFAERKDEESVRLRRIRRRLRHPRRDQGADRDPQRRGVVDDIDHLGNRRVRSVGEMAENVFRVGLVRVERAVKERLSMAESEGLMPQELINAKPVAAAIKEFFGSSQLSQFMDQNNPLSEVTHKRRVSALGPGGLTRERAGFEVRDVHPTHYGRVCTIETPEGPNIGLINSLAPSRAPTSTASWRRRTARSWTARSPTTSSSSRRSRRTSTSSPRPTPRATARTRSPRVRGLPLPGRVAAEAAERNPLHGRLADADRVGRGGAGAVPGARRRQPRADGREHAAPGRADPACAEAAGRHRHRACGGARLRRDRERPRGGVIEQIDAARIVVKVNEAEISGEQDAGVDIYSLIKYTRSNQNTCINQTPLVNVGDVVARGDVLADGPSTDIGELALGQNMLIAFMPWNGYNFEDSILLSERVVQEGSLHHDPHRGADLRRPRYQARAGGNHRRHPERRRARAEPPGRIRRGVHRRGSACRRHLVGKVTPKGESQLTPEEKLLRAIFGEKASDVKDSSLRVPPGMDGTVIDVQVFTRDGIEKDKRARQIEESEIKRVKKDFDDQFRILESAIYARLREDAARQDRQWRPGPEEGRHRVLAGTWTAEEVRLVQDAHEGRRSLRRDRARARQLDAHEKEFERRFADKRGKITAGRRPRPGRAEDGQGVPGREAPHPAGRQDGRPPRQQGRGVHHRAGRGHAVHGRRPPVDIVLNPLGVPSRMNIGQVLEVHLGWAAKGLGQKIQRMLDAQAKVADLRKFLDEIYNHDNNPDKGFGHAERVDLKQFSDAELLTLAQNLTDGVPMATPVFDGAAEAEIKKPCSSWPTCRSGQTVLHDGRTGEAFERGHRRLHAHAQAEPPGRRQDARAFDRPVLAGHPAAAGRQGAVRRPAFRRNGSLGAGSLRRGLHPAGNADGEVRRRAGPQPDVQEHRRWRARDGRGHAGVLQRAREGNPLALAINIELEEL